MGHPKMQENVVLTWVWEIPNMLLLAVCLFYRIAYSRVLK